MTDEIRDRLWANIYAAEKAAAKFAGNPAHEADMAVKAYDRRVAATPSPPVAAPPATPADVLAKAALYERLQPYLCKTCGGFGMVGGLVSYGDGNAGYESEPCPECAQPNFTDAYQGAREDLLMWKRRAQIAEQKLRDEQRTTSRLVAELNAANGPMRMGEPAAAQPQPQPAQPLTGAVPLSDEQIKAVCRSMLIRPWGIGSRPETAMAFARLIEAAHGITAPSTPTPAPRSLECKAMQDRAKEMREGDAVQAVRMAIRDYHYALDTRQHGGVAQGKAVGAIEEALGMPWKRGVELAARTPKDAGA